MECMMIQRAYNIIFVVGFKIRIEAKKTQLFIHDCIKKKPYNNHI